jgi:hypothetical protein
MWKTAIITGVCVSATLFVGFVTLGYLQKNEMLPNWVYTMEFGGAIQEAKDH